MMKTRGVLPPILAFIVAVLLAAAPASAQQITGVPGSPERHDHDRRQDSSRRRRRSSAA